MPRSCGHRTDERRWRDERWRTGDSEPEKDPPFRWDSVPVRSGIEMGSRARYFACFRAVMSGNGIDTVSSLGWDGRRWSQRLATGRMSRSRRRGPARFAADPTGPRMRPSGSSCNVGMIPLLESLRRTIRGYARTDFSPFRVPDPSSVARSPWVWISRERRICLFTLVEKPIDIVKSINTLRLRWSTPGVAMQFQPEHGPVDPAEEQVDPDEETEHPEGRFRPAATNTSRIRSITRSPATIPRP